MSGPRVVRHPLITVFETEGVAEILRALRFGTPHLQRERPKIPSFSLTFKRNIIFEQRAVSGVTRVINRFSNKQLKSAG